MKKYTVAVDFDGVIHSYTTPWIAAHIWNYRIVRYGKGRDA